jgi:hypothetical protein
MQPDPLASLLAQPLLAEITSEERERLSDDANVLRQLELIERGDRFATRAALHLWNEKKVSTLAVYLRAVDNVSHRAWRCTGAVDRSYELTDQLLGRLLDAGGDDTTYVLVSDHGWGYEPGPSFGHPHAPPGVIVVRGPHVRPGAAAERAPSVLDIAPTLLALHGLAPDSAYVGRPLRELFTEGSLAAQSREPVATYGQYAPVWPRSRGGIEAGQREAVDLLRSLGYLGD